MRQPEPVLGEFAKALRAEHGISSTFAYGDLPGHTGWYDSETDTCWFARGVVLPRIEPFIQKIPGNDLKYVTWGILLVCHEAGHAVQKKRGEPYSFDEHEANCIALAHMVSVLAAVGAEVKAYKSKATRRKIEQAARKYVLHESAPYGGPCP